MTDLLNNWLAVQDLGKQRQVAADSVLEEARNTAKAGMEDTDTVTTASVSALRTASTTLLVGLGAFAGLGHFLFTAAFRYAPASLLAPINYLQLVWAGLLGWLVFHHLPDVLTLVGMAIVAASGVLVALRSARRPVFRSLVNEIAQ